MKFTYSELRAPESELRAADATSYPDKRVMLMESAREKINKELDKREAKNNKLKIEYNKSL